LHAATREETRARKCDADRHGLHARRGAARHAEGSSGIRINGILLHGVVRARFRRDEEPAKAWHRDCTTDCCPEALRLTLNWGGDPGVFFAERSVSIMRRSHRVILPLLATAAALLLASVASAQTINVSYSWTAPTTGSPVAQYVVQQSIDGGAFTTVGTSTTTSYVLAATVGHAHRIRVAGVDAQSRQGPYSEASDPYTPDLGPPGQPGKPVVIF
jgi:hypothetical protein